MDTNRQNDPGPLQARPDARALLAARRPCSSPAVGARRPARAARRPRSPRRADRHRRRRRRASRCPSACRAGRTRRARPACRTLTQVLRNDLRFEGLFQFVPDSLLTAIPPLDPDAPNFEDWKGIGARILVVTRAERRGRRAHGRGARLLRGLRPDDARPALLGPGRQPARLRPPGLRRHHDPHPVQGRRPHADRLRLGPRRHAGAPLEGALHRRLRRLQPAPRHGERLAQHPARLVARRGRRSPTCPTARARRSSTSPRSSRARASPT